MKKTFYIFIIFWISVLILSFSLHYLNMKSNSKQVAYRISKSFFDFVVLTREWNAIHGGVYVFVTKDNLPNPYLKDPLRDIKINKNLMLTKINPAYMTRQLSELSLKEKGVHIGIKSLHPLNPINKPNMLEKKALLSFENGKKEFFKKINNKYFYMSVLLAKKPCIKCHKNKKIGDILGGISVLIPFSPEMPVGSLIFGHLLIGFIGIFFIIFSGVKLEEAYNEIKRQAIYDGLTEIYNRREFENRISQVYLTSKREKTPLSLIIADIDFFKKYNDTYGHNRGDECLRKVSKAISYTLKRPGDFCARYGGEEFVVVLPNTDLNGGITIAEQIRKNIEVMEIEHKHSTFKIVTVSLGVATVYNFNSITYEDLIKHADKALYNAKAKGRNMVCSYNS